MERCGSMGLGYRCRQLCYLQVRLKLFYSSVDSTKLSHWTIYNILLVLLLKSKPIQNSLSIFKTNISLIVKLYS